MTLNIHKPADIAGVGPFADSVVTFAFQAPASQCWNSTFRGIICSPMERLLSLKRSRFGSRLCCHRRIDSVANELFSVVFVCVFVCDNMITFEPFYLISNEKISGHCAMIKSSESFEK